MARHDQIALDVPRTFPAHALLRSEAGRDQLTRVLTAVAHARPDVGYCQGMSYVAAVLLQQALSPRMAALLLRWMLEAGRLDGYYSETMHGLIADARLFDHILEASLGQLKGALA